MISYDSVIAWGKVYDVIANRVSVINQMHDCRYKRAHGNPCALLYRAGRYEVTYCGEVVARFGLYDMTEVDAAFERVDMLARALWAGRSGGWVALAPVSAF